MKDTYEYVTCDRCGQPAAFLAKSWNEEKFHNGYNYVEALFTHHDSRFGTKHLKRYQFCPDCYRSYSEWLLALRKVGEKDV